MALTQIQISKQLAEGWPMAIAQAGCWIEKLALDTPEDFKKPANHNIEMLTTGEHDYYALIISGDAAAWCFFMKPISTGKPNYLEVVSIYPKDEKITSKFLAFSLHCLFVSSGGICEPRMSLVTMFQGKTHIYNSVLAGLNMRGIIMTAIWDTISTKVCSSTPVSQPLRLLRIHPRFNSVELWFGPCLDVDGSFRGFVAIRSPGLINRLFYRKIVKKILPVASKTGRVVI